MKTVMKLRKEVSHGGVIPRGWQIAWYEPRRQVGIYYPAPLHWLTRVLPEVTHRVGVAVRAPGMELPEVFQMQRVHCERLAEEYARGYMAGWRECFQTCLTAVEEEIARGYMAGWRECFQTCLTAVEEEIARADDAWDVGSFLPAAPKTPRERN